MAKEILQKLEGPTLYRAAKLESDAIVDEDERVIAISFSSEEPVERSSFFSDPWIEILGHKRGEMDLSRLNNGAPILYNHDRQDRDNRIGVVESAKIKNKRGVATIRISKRPEVDGLWQDIRDGILTNVSIGYQIKERKLIKSNDNAPDEYRVTKYLPMEISLVDIPADPTVGIGRDDDKSVIFRITDIYETPEVTENNEVRTMPDDDKSKSEADKIDDKSNVVDLDAVRKEGVEQEFERRKNINEIFEPFGDKHSELQKRCIDNAETNVEQARKLLLDSVGAEGSALSIDADVSIIPGEDSTDKFRKGASEALEFRCGLITNADELKKVSANEFRSYSLCEIARRALIIQNINASGMTKMEMIGRALTSSSDFPILLANVANKALNRGYDETPETFQLWTRKGQLSDFKISDRDALSSFSNLDIVDEGAEYTHGGFSEFREQIQLITYGKLFSLTRQAIINDDLNAFSEVPRKMGRAAARRVGDVVYAVLTVNANMSDGNPLFDATHSNEDSAGASAAITAVSFSALRQAMATQTDPSGNGIIGYAARWLLVPHGKEDEAKVLMGSSNDPAATITGVPNPVKGQAEVIVDHRLTEDDVNDWYVLADANIHDTVEVAFLDGNDRPVLEQQDGWTVDGVDFKVRIDAAAKALDWRGMQHQTGA